MRKGSIEDKKKSQKKMKKNINTLLNVQQNFYATYRTSWELIHCKTFLQQNTRDCEIVKS